MHFRYFMLYKVTFILCLYNNRMNFHYNMLFLLTLNKNSP
ncbi:conserved domain protein [Paenibacillus sp. HGF5]|nr:conserved domain protein [Paenibacillus sp. HGF5]